MSIGSVNYAGYTNYTNYTAKYIAEYAANQTSNKTGETTAESSFAESIKKSDASAKTGKSTAGNTTTGKVTESVVDVFRRKHPEDKAHVDAQVKAGKKVLEKNGVEDISREDMTMEEYKQFFTALMDSIPFDASHRGDVEIWSISEKGWEQMKNDPEYEAWVLGYTSENRSVYNPFASWPGYSPNVCTEKFGDSIEQHIGQSVPMSTGSSKKTDDSDEESWWVKRHKRLKEILEEQEKRARERAALNRNALEEQLFQEQMASNARLKQFLTNGVIGDEETAFGVSGHVTVAVNTYNAMMDLFSSAQVGGKL